MRVSCISFGFDSENLCEGCVSSDFWLNRILLHFKMTWTRRTSDWGFLFFVMGKILATFRNLILIMKFFSCRWYWLCGGWPGNFWWWPWRWCSWFPWERYLHFVFKRAILRFKELSKISDDLVLWYSFFRGNGPTTIVFEYRKCSNIERNVVM